MVDGREVVRYAAPMIPGIAQHRQIVSIGRFAAVSARLRLRGRIRTAVFTSAMLVAVLGGLDFAVASDCLAPVRDTENFKHDATLGALYTRAFAEEFEQREATEEQYRSALKGAPDGERERRAWSAGVRDGRRHGLARTRGWDCLARISPGYLSTEGERIEYLRDFMRQAILAPDQEWIQWTWSAPYCQQLLPDFLNARANKAIEPLLRFEERDHPALAKYRACAQPEASSSPYRDEGKFWQGDIGTMAFRYYGDLSIGGSRRHRDVVYSEILPTEQHRYGNGYRALDAASCEMAALASVRPTTFRTNQSDPSFLDNILIQWRGQVISLELNGLPPFSLEADRLRVTPGDRSLDCRWGGGSNKKVASRMVAEKKAKLIPKSIIKHKKP